MKKILISTIFLLSSLTISAQLQVSSAGNVGIRNAPQTNCPLYVKGELLGVAGYVNKSNLTSSDTQIAVSGVAYQLGYETSIGVKGRAYGYYQNSKSIGVWGETDGNTNGYNFGVAGYLRGTSRGTAIFGTTNVSSTHPFMYDRYAGYFDGNVKVAGTITTTSSINGISLSYASDSPSSVASSRSEVLGNMSSLLMPFRAKTFLIACGEKDENHELGTSEKQVLSKQHYGLDADQLEEVLPDLVYENEDGTKSINYVEMVPILVQAINELSAKLEALEGVESKAQTRAADIERSGGEMGENVTLLSLGENRPNPFSNTTTIPVSIPADVQKAFIYVYDLTGKKVQQLDIIARGKHNVTLDAYALTDGMYLYSLIADGKVVQMRRMIVEK